MVFKVQLNRTGATVLPYFCGLTVVNCCCQVKFYCLFSLSRTTVQIYMSDYSCLSMIIIKWKVEDDVHEMLCSSLGFYPSAWCTDLCAKETRGKRTSKQAWLLKRSRLECFKSTVCQSRFVNDLFNSSVCLLVCEVHDGGRQRKESLHPSVCAFVACLCACVCAHWRACVFVCVCKSWVGGW